jgi:hypothetical protein
MSFHGIARQAADEVNFLFRDDSLKLQCAEYEGIALDKSDSDAECEYSRVQLSVKTVSRMPNVPDLSCIESDAFAVAESRKVQYGRLDRLKHSQDIPACLS